MGEAKRRGTYEERLAGAKKKQHKINRFIHLSMLIGRDMSMSEIVRAAARRGLEGGKVRGQV